MHDAEWQVKYPGVEFTFGGPDRAVWCTAPPDLGDVALSVDDVDRPRGDGMLFGQDYRGGQTITFELGINAEAGPDRERRVRDAAAELARVWRADSIRQTAGATAELWTRSGGRLRLKHGRPRRFALNDRYAHQGYMTAVADFACVDDVWYGGDAREVSVSLVPPPSGGLVTPIEAPFETTEVSQRAGAMDVYGELPAWPVITIYGPISDPEVSITGLWSLRLATTIAHDRAILVDTRPWFRRIIRDYDGASFAGTLRGVRLANASIPPGSHEVVLRGTDQTGTSSLRVQWRDSYTTR